MHIASRGMKARAAGTLKASAQNCHSLTLVTFYLLKQLTKQAEVVARVGRCQFLKWEGGAYHHVYSGGDR